MSIKPGRSIFFKRIAALFILITFSAFVGNQACAQVATYYNFTQSAGTYTAVAVAGTPANVMTTAWDDVTTSYALPFNFTFNGTLYPAGTGFIGVDSDGWITFSNGAPIMTGNTGGGSWVSISDQTGVYLNGTGNNNGFAGFNCDLNEQTFATFIGSRTSGSPTITGVSSTLNLQVGTRLTGTGITDGTVVVSIVGTTVTMSANATATSATAVTPRSSIYAFTAGVAPNRQFVLQWTQAKRYSSTGENINFQMILNEGNANPTLQTLQVIYGSCTATSATALETQVGLRGASTADFNARKSTTGWAATAAATANTDLVRFSNTLNPASGLTFTWSPCTAAPGAAGAIAGSAGPVCPNTSQVYSIAAIAGATSYNWTYSGTGTTFTATTTSPSNTYNFSSTATSGTITVTPVNLCGSGTASSLPVTVTAVTAATISYPLPSYCSSASGTVTVTQTGPGGGTYTTNPATGLTIFGGTGTITPGSSTAGTYTVIYSYTSSGCSVTATTTVTISVAPTVTATAAPASVCVNTAVQLTATASGTSNYTVVSIPYAATAPSGTPTTVWNAYIDDGNSAAIPLPFAFTFYGSAITQFYINTNGHIQLQTGVTPANTAQTLPNAATPNNVVALAWSDLVVDPSTNTGSNVRYFLNGITPNRVMVVEYTNLRFLAGSGSQNVTGQIRLYESDSHIEVAAGTVNDNSTSVTKTLGIENSTGTLGITPAGRNNVVWNTSNEAWAFYPPVGTISYSWSPSTYLSSTGIYNPVSTPTAVSTTVYTVTATNAATGCAGTATATVTAVAPLSGIKTVGVGGDYTTLTAAVNAYNTLCIGGPVVFSLTDALYSTSETFPISINSNAYQSATNTLTIRPASGVNTTITGSVASNALITVTGKYISIDGSNNGSTSLNMNISNTSTTSPRVVLLGSVAAAGVTNCALKNCTISNGINSSSAIVLSDAGTIGTAGYFSNDTIQNNIVQKAYIGIYAIGVNSAGNGTGLNILSNNLTAPGANALYAAGIYTQDLDGVTIKDNLVGNLVGTDSYDDKGIWLATGMRNSNVLNNTVTNLNYTGTGGYGAYGICISSGVTNANILVANNMIANISGDGFSYTSASFALDNPVGIMLFTTQTGINIYHNSINLGTPGFTNTLNKTDAISAGIRLFTGSTADIRNNIIVNNLGRTGSSNSTGYGAIGILVSTSNTQFTNLDFNDYAISPTGSIPTFFGQIAASGQTTLATWRTATGREAASINIAPVFAAATDLHLTPASNLSLNNTGTPIAAITTDFDNTTRNGLTPDIGADEFLAPGTGSWVGKISIDWLVPANWETNVVPDLNTDVSITGGYTFMPAIVTTQAVRNIALSAPGTPPLLTLNAGTLQVYGAITRTGGTINGSNGTLEMKGAAAQIIPASLFTSNNLLNLIISNTETTTGVMLGGVLDIYRSVSFGIGGRKLTTSNALTFKSTATQTAWLDQMTASNVISGNATIERYIPLHTKAWQFLSTPITATSTQTVNQAWQEGSVTANDNLVTGYGTQLTSNRAGAATRPTPGFDVYTAAGPSIKVYNRTTGGYTGLNRTDTLISNPKGYMVFVRGNRSVYTLAAPATATVMRTKGTLHTPANPPVTMNLPTTGFESIGNPYPSAINYRLVTKTGGVQTDVFYLWDPKLTTAGPSSAWGLGGIQTFTWNMFTLAFDVTPGGGSYTGTNRFIESGQAFFVNAPSSAGTVSFTEACKVTGSYSVNRVPVSSTLKQLRTNLNVMVNNERVLLDGNMAQFDHAWSNKVDMNDAVKMNNTGENLGLMRAGKTLSVERHDRLQRNDTIYYKLGQPHLQQYELEFIPSGLQAEGLDAFLEDKYLNTSTAVSLNDTSRISFSIINDAASYAADRFYLVFRKPKKQHVVTGINTLSKTENSKNPANQSVIRLYPNPVKDRIIQLQFIQQPAGTYSLQLTNKLGQQVYTGFLEISGQSEMKKIILDPGIIKGIYQLTITAADGAKTTKQVVIE